MYRIDCTPEEKIHTLLLDLKKNTPYLYDPVKRVLSYLYKTIKCDYFEKSIMLEYGKYKDDCCSKIISAQNNLYDNYIDGEDAILDIFINMCHDHVKYFNHFFSTIEPFLEMSEEHLYSGYEIFNYVFNIYTMLKTYDICKDDYETFAKTVDAFVNFFVTSKVDMKRGYSSSLFFLAKQEFVSKATLIDDLIELKKYKALPLFDEMLKQILDEINMSYNNSTRRQYDELIASYKELYENIRDENCEFNPQTVERIEQELETLFKENKNNKASPSVLKYCSKVLLVGERYNFIKSALPEVEPTPKFQKDILMRISAMNAKFFDDFNKEIESESDTFITLMKIVFASGTYFELISKLDCINQASTIYQEDPQKAFQLIESLNTDKYKEEINGVKMAWPKNNSLNQGDRPKTILERTIALHTTLEYAPTVKDYYERIESTYYTKNILEFIQSTRSQFEFNEKKALEALKKEQEELEKAELPPESPRRKGLNIFKK